MWLAIDAGNTNTTFALFDGDALVASFRLKTDAQRTPDEYAAFFESMTRLKGMPAIKPECAVVSSVVPDANFHLRQFLEQGAGIPAHVVDVTARDYGVKIDIDRPGEVGADRIVNALAVRTAYVMPAVVIDFGTATTFDVVAADGSFCGGVIAPGLQLSLNALHAAAAKLPKISVQNPGAAIGRSTVQAMQSGLYFGCVGMIEGLVRRIAAELGAKPVVIATGGLAPLFSAEKHIIDHFDDTLTLKGLALIRRQVFS